MTQSAHELAMNKLIILFLIHHIKMPLSNTQITEFVLERNYTDYFSVQQYLTELVDANLLQMETENHTTRYIIEPKGIEALEYFLTRIPESTRQEILEYIQSNRRQIRHDLEITAEYIPEKNNEYIVHCKVKENDTTLIDLKVNVVSKNQAKLICDNWKKNAQNLYGNILSSLIETNSND